MPVFDATRNQVLFSPVSNYYQGKAIRQQLAAGEQDQELKGLQIDLAKQEIADAPSKREAAKQKALLDLENIRSQVDERYAKGEREKLKYADEVMKPLFQAYSDEPDEEKAKEIFNAGLPEAISRLSEEEQEKFRAADKDRDGEYSHDEIVGAGLYRRVVEEKEKSYTVVPLEEKLAMGMPKEWADNTIVERDAEGNLTFNNRPTGLTGEDLAARGDDPRTNSQKGAAYQQNVDEYNVSSDVQEMITSALPQIIELPGSVGIKGTIGLGGAGVLSSLGQEEMANAFSQYMSGASPEEIAQIQTQLQTIRGRIIPIVTGEQGKRLSETEREIASKAVGLIESIKGPADLSKAYPQVLGAMRQLYAESWATKYRLASHDENINYPYDLSDKDERIELFTEFSEAGVDINTAKRTVIRLKSIQGVE